MKPKNAAQTGSIENASAVRVALVRRCAHVWARNASALAKTPVTSSAPQTVQPCGNGRSRERERDREQAGERGQHLDERERERVVARGVALHQDDLERVDGGAGEHEQVAEQRAAVDAGEQREAGGRERDAEPGAAADARAGRGRARAAACRTTYMPVMKPVEETVVRSSPAVCSA